MPLESELETFRRELPTLLADAANVGKYAMIHGDRVQGVYPDIDGALAAGYEQFGLSPFLVQEIVEHERPRHFPRNVVKWPS